MPIRRARGPAYTYADMSAYAGILALFVAFDRHTYWEFITFEVIGLITVFSAAMLRRRPGVRGVAWPRSGGTFLLEACV